MRPLNPSLSLPAPLALGLSSQSAHLLSLLFTSTYVGSIYISQHFLAAAQSAPSPSARPPSDNDGTAAPALPPIAATDSDALPFPAQPDEPQPGSRDHPLTIRSRMSAVGVATILSVGGLWYVVKATGNYDWVQAVRPTLRLLGVPSALTLPSHPCAVFAYLAAPTLLLGPLLAECLDGDMPFQGTCEGGLTGRMRRWWRNFDLVNLRNYVVGPVTEELVFRASIIAVSLLAHLPVRTIVFGTPLWFGLAHVHHAWEVYRKNGSTREAARQAIGTSVFQLSYTTLFGWFASYLFVRTGSVVPPLLSHMFCNYMGIYLPSTAARRHPKWKKWIWGTYAVGVLGFVDILKHL